MPIYPFAEKKNGNMEDLLKIKDSYIKYVQLCNDEKSVRGDKWLSLLDKTEWFYHIITALDTSIMVLNSIKVYFFNQISNKRLGKVF